MPAKKSKKKSKAKMSDDGGEADADENYEDDEFA